MQGLMLHCGGNLIERSAIMALPEPEPRGPRHRPIHHGEFLEHIDRTLGTYGLQVKEEAFGTSHDHDRFFGVMALQGAGIVEDEERTYDFVIGLRGSHDQVFKRSIAGGSRVFVCDNLAFSAEIVMETKQTTNILSRLPLLLEGVVSKIGDVSAFQAKRIEKYRDNFLSPPTADAVITEMVRRQIVNPSDIGRVIHGWDEPAHEEFKLRNVWSLFNAVTETFKPRKEGENSRLPVLTERTVKLHELCDEVCVEV